MQTEVTNEQHQDRIILITEALRAAVDAAVERGERPSRATLSQLDFSLFWQHLGAVGVKHKSAQQALAIYVHYPSCSVTVSPSSWCPDGRAGVG